MTRKRDNRGQGIKSGNIYHITTFPPQAGGNRREGDIDRVIANEVKQFQKIEIRLHRLPVHYTQTGRFIPRNDNLEQ